MNRAAAVPLMSMALLGLAGYHVAHNSQPKPPLAAPAPPARSPWGASIAGSGIVEPCTENIAVGTHVGGVVQEVLARVGQEVTRGTPLFRIDERQLRAELALREARLASAEAQWERLEQQPRAEELPGSAAKVREAQARREEEIERYGRGEVLRGKGWISDEDFASRRQALAVAREQLAQASAADELLRAGAWDPDKRVSRAAVAEARAQLEQTRTDLARLTVTAPVDGQVLQVDVRPGEYVAESATTELLVLGNIRPLHVRVDVDESDIPRLSLGRGARGFVRGQTDHPIPLDFVRVEPYVIPKKSLNGSNTEQVDTRVLQVIFAVSPVIDVTLYVGQQLDVFIDAAPADAGTSLSQPPALSRN
jgi:multidrug efflux pump subunit AcrA (membrane-fusion protein)